MLHFKKISLLAALFTIIALLVAGQLATDSHSAKASPLFFEDPPCATNGYKTWGGWWWYDDGKDCWCEDRFNVVDPCESSDPGEG